MSILVGKKAPKFNGAAVINGNEIVNDFSLDQFLGKKYVIFFFYPKDFTFVCPTELHAFQEKLSEFEKRNCQLVACSTDTEQSHWGWLQAFFYRVNHSPVIQIFLFFLKFDKYTYFNLALNASTILNVAGQIATFFRVRSDIFSKLFRSVWGYSRQAFGRTS